MLCAGENIWRRSNAKKISFLLESANYYEALAQCLGKAKHTICILGWDVGSHVELIKGPDHERYRLGQYLNDLVEKNKNLTVRILCWNFPLAYSPHRETPLSLISGWNTSERIILRYDDSHPVGGSEHQKVIVLDDEIGFCGGIDVCERRWDTCKHTPDDERRKDRDGNPYPPYHDIQMMVQGEVAKDLGDLFRERWQRATEEKLSIPNFAEKITWPKEIPFFLENKPVATSLTLPRFGGYEENRAIEKLTIAAIRSAKKTIYIENQFLTAVGIYAALRTSLRETEGPEVIIILPKVAANFLEEVAMRVLQNKIVRKLRAIDKFKRLGVYFPQQDGEQHGILIHSKLIIIDNQFLKVGSANFNNRSMGLDSECDLSMEAQSDTQVANVIELIRTDLLAEHLNLSPIELNNLYSTHRSWNKVIGLQTSSARCLLPLNHKSHRLLRWLSLGRRIVDPGRPLKREQIISEYLRGLPRPPTQRPVWGIALVVTIFLGLAVFWKMENVFKLRDLLFPVLSDFRVDLLTTIVFGLSFLPPTFIFIVTFTLLGPKWGFIFGWLGVTGVALLQYLFGAFLPTRIVKKMVRWGSNSFGQKLARLRALPDVLLRILPVAPLPIVNLASGASRMPLPAFFFFSIFSVLPLLTSFYIGELILDSSARYFGRNFSSGLLALIGILFLIIISLHPKGRSVMKGARNAKKK